MDDSSDSMTNNLTNNSITSDTFTSTELEQFLLSNQTNLYKTFQYLHEDVAQALRALTLAIPNTSETEEIKAFALETMQKAKEMAFILYPMPVVELGLATALDSLINNLNMLYNLPENVELESKASVFITTKLEKEPSRVTALITYGLLEILSKLFLKRGHCTIDILLIERPKNRYRMSIDVNSLKQEVSDCNAEIQRVMTEMDIRLRLTALSAEVDIDDNFINISFVNSTLQKSGEGGNNDL